MLRFVRLGRLYLGNRIFGASYLGSIRRWAIETRSFQVSVAARRNIEDDTKEPVDNTDATEELPWYLRETPDLKINEERKTSIPSIPEGAPKTLEQLLEILCVEYGLEEVKLFDLNELDASHPNSTENQPFNYIIIATGKSERHIHKAGQELKYYIKHNYSEVANINGLVSNAPSPVARRRMLKRANKSPLATDNDYGRAANSWIMCDTRIDNICIHILTKQRREELNLESLWTEDPQSVEYSTGSILDDQKNSNESSYVPYFFQSRRQLHTRSYSISSSAHSLTDIYNQIMTKEPKELNQKAVGSIIDQFNSQFNNPDIVDYNVRNKFFTMIHLSWPEIVSFEHLNEILLGKYTNLSVAMKNASSTMKLEKETDVVEFMKLLLDSPELNAYSDKKLLADERYNLLSQYLSNIYRFSDDSINLESSPEFIPLLWKLSFPSDTSEGQDLGSSTIDEILYNNNEEPYSQTFKTSVQAENRTRDITDILDYYLTTKAESCTLSRSIKELQLFSFGNAANWDQFWYQWDVSLNLLNDNNNQDFHKWIRLVIYLALRNDKSANKTFLQDYWQNTSKISGSFLQNYDIHHQLLTKSESHALKVAMSKILDSLADELSSSKLDELRTFINQL